MILLKSVFIIAIVAVAMIGLMVPSVFAVDLPSPENYPNLVSVSPDGLPGNGQSNDPYISADGRFVVFHSDATNLVDDDENYQRDVFVRDLLNEKTELVSISSDGKQGDRFSELHSMSADGRFVVFTTRSSFDSDDTNEKSDVYMRDRESSKTIWISKPSNLQDGGGGEFGMISADGRFVIFQSRANYLSIGDNIGNLFLWDNTRLTLTALPIYANNYSISGNGEKIQFNGGNSVPEGVEGEENDLYVYDRTLRKITNISKPITEFHSHQSSSVGAMDFEGNKIAFQSYAPNLVDNDENNGSSFFLYNFDTSENKLISITPNNEAFTDNYSLMEISDDGKFVLMKAHIHSEFLVYDVEEEKSSNDYNYFGKFTPGRLSGNNELITYPDTWWPHDFQLNTHMQIFVTPFTKKTDSSSTANESVQTENPSSNAGLIIDKIIYHPGELIKISGAVKDSQKGTQVKLILTNPDGTNTGLTIYPNDDGEYSTLLQINSEYELGEYSILSSYNSKILGKELFSIQVKSQNNYDSSIIAPTPKPVANIHITMASGSGGTECALTLQGCYLPKVASVSTGSIVTFSNTDTSAHTVTSGSPADGPSNVFDSSLLMAGDVFEWTPNSSGQYDYFCMLHPWAIGTIMVDGVPYVAPEPVVEPIPEPAFLGIASFVDQTKDPQHYIDRYNNESTYKEWFDENYPQYLSIYQAVGMKETPEDHFKGCKANDFKTEDCEIYVDRINNKISGISPEVTSTPNCETELVNGICPVIQTGVGTYHTVDFMNIFVNNFENNVGCGIVPNPNSNFYMCMGEFWDDDGVEYSLGLRQDLNKGEDIFTHISNVQQPEKISELDATCYSGWFMNSLKRLVCVVDDEFSIKLTVYKYHDPIPMMKQILEKINGPTLIPKIENSKGGGCLIATATYGSEMAIEVQQLRELRDNQLLQTESGSEFMSTFNNIYYSFSPVIADYERENPLFKEAVKLAITPMISSLSLMENANSESEVLSIGISVIMLNLGMYLGIPAIVIIGIKKKF
jgi:hypothetical protein